METNDHDILIEVKTILKGVVEDFRAYRGDNHKQMSVVDVKLDNLEKNKVSVVDFRLYKDDNEARMRKLERAYWIGLTLVGVIQFLAPVILSKVFHI